MFRFIVFAAFVQAVILQITHAVCVNRVVPKIVPVEAILQNPVVYNRLPNIVPNVINPKNVIIPNNIVVPNRAPCGCGCQNILPVDTIVPNQLIYNPLNAVETVVPGPAPVTVIQDSSVANNLANALQLLVVSNLLSNTLPVGPEVVTPCGLDAYNYFY